MFRNGEMWWKISFIVSSLLILRGNCNFIKIGPCLIGWKKTCPDHRINFYLFTKESIYGPQKIEPTQKSILNSTYNPKNPNKIILHGYNSNMNLFQLERMKEEYLHVNDYNVWMVDWREVAAGPCYPIVVGNLDYVGKCIAELVQQILLLNMVPMDKAFHLIGFSIGAHLAAYVANHVRPYKVARITGLDPALPLFTTPVRDHKLDKTDANFVDVIHSDALKEGKVESCGHADFYMNGGIEQPGCNGSGFIETSICNHYRSAAYFAESIVSQVGFYGWFCEGFLHYVFNRCPPVKPTVLMGEYIDRKTRGSYIVHTAAQDPFAIGKNYSLSQLQAGFLLSLNSTSYTEDEFLVLNNSSDIEEDVIMKSSEEFLIANT